jgi:hypothetical protein
MPFDTAVGDTPIAKAYVGTTPVIRTYVGDKHVWPPFSTTVTYVASTVFTGTTNVTFPTHSAGDLLVLQATGNTAPTAPAGWTVVHTSPSGNPAAVLAYKWATGAGTGTGSWANNVAGLMYVIRNADKTNPIGAVSTSVGPSSTTVTAPALTLTDPTGSSLVAHSYFNSGSTGGWANKATGNFLIKNLVARLGSSLAIDTRGATVEPSTLTHSAAATWRSLAFEVLAPAAQVGLYGCDVEYLPNYEVRFTAKTSYAEGDPDEVFFFRSTPIANDGYTGRTFTKTYRASAVPMDCTLEDYWQNPTGIRNTINFQISPKP